MIFLVMVAFLIFPLITIRFPKQANSSTAGSYLAAHLAKTGHLNSQIEYSANWKAYKRDGLWEIKYPAHCHIPEGGTPNRNQVEFSDERCTKRV